MQHQTILLFRDIENSTMLNNANSKFSTCTEIILMNFIYTVCV